MLNEILTSALNKPIKVCSKAPLSGGDINDVFKIETNAETFCIKQNRRDRFPQMFQKEALGLEELAKHSNFRIPKVYGSFEDSDNQFLILEFIESNTNSNSFWEDFGRQLAQMHQVSQASFGWTSDNYIGSLVQSNKTRDSWVKFYTEKRISPQLKLAFENGKIDRNLLHQGEKLCEKFDQLFPKEPPALLHGDLWSGNYMTDEQGNPVLIDPAVYYGHREMDLGMMQLFGGFSAELFDVYDASYPLEQDWKNRISLTQLYPLLVHVNLFGESYVQRVRSVIQKFS